MGRAGIARLLVMHSVDWELDLSGAPEAYKWTHVAF